MPRMIHHQHNYGSMRWRQSSQLQVMMHLAKSAWMVGNKYQQQHHGHKRHGIVQGRPTNVCTSWQWNDSRTSAQCRRRRIQTRNCTCVNRQGTATASSLPVCNIALSTVVRHGIQGFESQANGNVRLFEESKGCLKQHRDQKGALW